VHAENLLHVLVDAECLLFLLLFDSSCNTFEHVEELFGTRMCRSGETARMRAPNRKL
jgi:hypothetical protein